MLWTAALLSALSHHGEADPALLEWIKDVLDQLIGLGPWTVVILLGLLVLAIPVVVVVFYLSQQRRAPTPDPSPFGRGEATPSPTLPLRKEERASSFPLEKGEGTGLS